MLAKTRAKSPSRDHAIRVCLRTIHDTSRCLRSLLSSKVGTRVADATIIEHREHGRAVAFSLGSTTLCVAEHFNCRGPAQVLPDEATFAWLNHGDTTPEEIELFTDLIRRVAVA